MPQFIPFFHFSQLIFTLTALFTLIFLMSTIFLPNFVFSQVIKTYILKLLSN